MTTYDQLIQQAEERSQRGESLQAMQLYADAAKSAPERTEPLIELATLFAEQGDDEGACGFLEKALELDPRNALVRLQLGLRYYEQNQIPKAVRHLKAAVLIIQHFVSSTRIDAMFAEENEAESVLAEVAEVEETGVQAIELLQEIASELVPERPERVKQLVTEEPLNLAS